MAQIGSFNGNPVYEGELPDDLDMSRPWFLVPSQPDPGAAGVAGDQWSSDWVEIGATQTDEAFPATGRLEPRWPDAMRSAPARPRLIGAECQPACLLMGELIHDD